MDFIVNSQDLLAELSKLGIQGAKIEWTGGNVGTLFVPVTSGEYKGKTLMFGPGCMEAPETCSFDMTDAFADYVESAEDSEDSINEHSIIGDGCDAREVAWWMWSLVSPHTHKFDNERRDTFCLECDSLSDYCKQIDPASHLYG